MTKQSGKKERCCRHCYTQHSAVVERFTAAELSPSDVQPPPPGAGPQPPPEPASYIPTPRVTGEKKKHVYSLISQMSTCTDSFLVYVSDPHSSCKQKWKFSWGRRTETFTVNSCANGEDDDIFIQRKTQFGSNSEKKKPNCVIRLNSVLLHFSFLMLAWFFIYSRLHIVLCCI